MSLKVTKNESKNRPNPPYLFRIEVLGGILHWFDESRWESAMTSFFVYIFRCHRKTVGFHASSTNVESYFDSMKILRALAHCHWKTVGFHIIISIVESYLVSMTTIIKSWILGIFQKMTQIPYFRPRLALLAPNLHI